MRSPFLPPAFAAFRRRRLQRARRLRILHESALGEVLVTNAPPPALNLFDAHHRRPQIAEVSCGSSQMPERGALRGVQCFATHCCRCASALRPFRIACPLGKSHCPFPLWFRDDLHAIRGFAVVDSPVRCSRARIVSSVVSRFPRSAIEAGLKPILLPAESRTVINNRR
jgi:hypothetical protein